MNIVPVIIAGGKGSRLWPTSTADLPKQFIPLKSGKTTFENSLLRVESTKTFSKPIIVCAEQNVQIVQRLTTGRDVSIICEPIARNTAPACCVGALEVQEMAKNDSALMLILPADHYIPDVKIFEEAVRAASDAARAGKIVTFGINPEFGCIEYGYIEYGDEIENGVLHVQKFVEKPDVKTADTYFKSGDYLWNAGIFLARADVILDEMYESDLLYFSRRAWEDMAVMDRYRLLPLEQFSKATNASFDCVVMQSTKNAAVMKAGFKWADLGGWDALMEFAVPNQSAS